MSIILIPQSVQIFIELGKLRVLSRCIFFIFFFQFLNVYGQQKTLGLTKHLDGSLDNGYILFAPLECKTTYLIDKCGHQIHTWKSNYEPGFSAYLLPDGHLLRTGVFKDTSVMKGSNGGIIENMDWDGNIIWSYLLFNDSMGQHHDIYPMDNGNILVVTRHVISSAEAITKGRNPNTLLGSKIYSERILELKPIGKNEAKVVWQWSAWDHLVQDQHSSLPNYGVISQHPELMNINYTPNRSTDWIHINSIDYNRELDQILLSCKSLNEIWIIDHSTSTKEAASHNGGKSGMGGDILYRWGNQASYGLGSINDQKFFHQHNAHWIPKGYKDGGDIMVFNNGLNRIPAYSSVEILDVPELLPGKYSKNLPYAPLNPKWIYKDSVPENFFSGFKSGASRLSNGSTLICSGLNGKFFEVDSNNRIVWEYINPVASGDKILEDGQSGGSVVFKCVYYPDSFSGFNGKRLTSQGVIENKSFPYSCIFNSKDSIPPYPIGFFPKNKSKKANWDTPLKITFNEAIIKGLAGSIYIYENNTIKELIPINDKRISVSGNEVSINAINFNTHSKISISIEKGCFKDLSGNEVLELKWAYKTGK